MKSKTVTMSEEIFDIVDEHNQLTGEQKSRMVVHQEMKDWHRITGIYIINDKKEILCQKRSIHKDANPGMWQPNFGGHLKAGQSYDENAIQELAEELGLQIDISQLIKKAIHKTDSFKHFGQRYILRLNKDIADMKNNDGEVEELAWLNLTDIDKQVAQGKFCGKVDEEIREYIKSI